MEVRQAQEAHGSVRFGFGRLRFGPVPVRSGSGSFRFRFSFLSKNRFFNKNIDFEVNFLL